MNANTNFETSTILVKLKERREELLNLGQASEGDRLPVDLDQSRIGRLSRMDALQAQEMAKEVGRRRMLELGRINASLKRIDDGEYGYCLSCDEKISAERLALDPTLPNCMACAQKLENKSSEVR